MLVRFLRDSFLYAASAALSRGVAIILVPLYTRFLQPAEYGALDLLMVVATLMNYVIALEISQGVARVYADAKTVEDRQEYVSTALWYAAAAYGLFVTVALAFPLVIAEQLLDSPKWEDAARAMILAVAANGMFFLLQDLLRWQLQPLRHAAASLTYTAFSTGVGVYLVVVMHAGVAGILYGQCAGAAAGLAVSWWNGAAAYWKLTFRWTCWKEMASYSAPQVISSIAAYFSLYVDRVLIKELMTLDDLGVYGVGARIASVVALLMAGFQSGLIPIVFHNHASPDTPPQIARAFRYFLTFATALLLFLSGFSKELVWLFTTAQYYGSWDVIPVLAAAMLFASMYIFVPGVFIARRTSLVAVINLGALLLNVSGTLLLVPRLGMMGAALATAISNAAAFLLYVYCNRLFYPIPFEWRRILLAGAVTGVLAVLLASAQQVSWPAFASISLRAAICLAGGGMIALALIGRAELALAARKLYGRAAPQFHPRPARRRRDD